MIDPAKILGSRILLVDDQQANIQLLEMMLQRAGYLRIDSTVEPTTVYELHLKNNYDLILLDLLMPGMD